MNNGPAEAWLPLKVTVAFSGHDSGVASLHHLNADDATITFQEKRPLWVGRLLAICIGDLPAIPARIRTLNGTEAAIAFVNPLHPTVLEYAKEQVLAQNS